MDRRNLPSAGAAYVADEIQMLVGALAHASTRRHGLLRGTAEYDAALETEERLAAYVWSLATARETSDEGVTGSKTRDDTPGPRAGAGPGRSLRGPTAEP